MFYYKMYGVVVGSEFKIPAGYIIDEQEPDVVVRHIKTKEIMPELHIIDREYGVVQMNDGTMFHIKNGSEIIVKASEEVDWFKVTQYIATECLPAILFQRGVFTIHGSCIEVNDGALIITGASGAGKSSLANEFIESGCRILADDTVGVDVVEDDVYAIPAFPQRKLVVDMVEKVGIDSSKLIDLKQNVPKYAINVDEQYCNQPRKLKALVWVCKHSGKNVEIHEVTGADKLKFLMDTSYEYMLYVNDKVQQDEFKTLVKICNDVVFYVVLRPEGGYTTKEQMQQIVTKL